MRSVRLGVAPPAVQDGRRTHACTTQIEQLVILVSGPNEQVNVNMKLTVDLCETKKSAATLKVALKTEGGTKLPPDGLRSLHQQLH